jgi:hypothetical protein
VSGEVGRPHIAVFVDRDSLSRPEQMNVLWRSHQGPSEAPLKPRPRFLINVVGLRRAQYGLIFAATSLGIMGGACLKSRFNARGVPPGYPLAIGLGVATASSMLLLTHDLGSLDAAARCHFASDPGQRGVWTGCTQRHGGTALP